MRNDFRRSRKGLHILKFMAMGAAFILAIGFVTMTLWNCLIPDLFHGPVITFWQALGLLLLGKLLFGWHNHHNRSWEDKWARGREWKAKFREKMAHMTPEEQARVREQLRNRCGRGFGGSRREGWGRYWSDMDEAPRKPEEPNKDEQANS